MKRKKVTPATQAEVLLKSRRRCCICFGLNRDTSIKQGQIAHLDHDPSNNNESNLAFLCFNHHDQYDSRTKQSKNFTIQEVIYFKNELASAITLEFSRLVSFGNTNIFSKKEISGHYIRDGEFDSAEIMIEQLPSGSFHISGFSLWGKLIEYGPYTGELDFVGSLLDGEIKYEFVKDDNIKYKLVLNFQEESLVVSEENWIGVYGMNVTFQGEYHRA
jgi:hypothetical protein